MRIVVTGAGAIGSAIGGLLRLAGEDVTLIERLNPVVTAIQSRGLLLSETQGERSIPVKVAKTLDFTPDLLLIATKSQDILQACQELRPLVPGVPTVMLQNGMSGDGVAGSILGKDQIVGCVIRFGVQSLGPGQIRIQTPGRLLLGNPFGPDLSLARSSASVISQGVSSAVTDNLTGAKWAKLLRAVQMSIQAALGKTGYAGDQDLLALSIGLVKEGLAVADALGVRLEDLEGIPAASFEAVGRVPLDACPVEVPEGAAPALLFACVETAALVSSMLQSRLRGAMTEVDFINGDVARFGQQAGVPAPLNRRMTEIMHELEASGRFLQPGELVTAFAREPR